VESQAPLWQKRRMQMLIQQTTDMVDPSSRAQGRAYY